VPGVWSLLQYTPGPLYLWAAPPNEHARQASVIESAD
jgi:hypothetical protein